MTAAICVKCELEMKPYKTGAFVEEMAGIQPYKVWAGDAFKCEQCGATIVTRFGLSPCAQHFEDKYLIYAMRTICRAFQRIEDKVERAERDTRKAVEITS